MVQMSVRYIKISVKIRSMTSAGLQLEWYNMYKLQC